MDTLCLLSLTIETDVRCTCREMFEDGEQLSERLKTRKMPITKIANLGRTVQDLVA